MENKRLGLRHGTIKTLKTPGWNPWQQQFSASYLTSLQTGLFNLFSWSFDTHFFLLLASINMLSNVTDYDEIKMKWN